MKKSLPKPVQNTLIADTYLLKLPHFIDAPGNLKYATEGSWCFDICAAIPEAVIIKPGERYNFPTGVKFIFPEPLWYRFCPRSGLAIKHGFSIMGGLIDNDYRGEPTVCLLNTSNEEYKINPGDRIAQVEIPFPYKAKFIEITKEEYAEFATTRGAGGFGSTGK